MCAEAAKVLPHMPASTKPSHGIQKEVRRDVRVLEVCCQDCNDQALFQRYPIHEDKCPIQGAMQDQNSTCAIMYIVQAQEVISFLLPSKHSCGVLLASISLRFVELKIIVSIHVCIWRCLIW